MGLNCRNVFLFKSVKLNYHYLWRDGLCLIWFHHVFMNDQETDLKYNFGTYLVKDDNLPSVIRRPGTYICTYTSYELLLVLLRVQIQKILILGDDRRLCDITWKWGVTFLFGTLMSMYLTKYSFGKWHTFEKWDYSFLPSK